MITATLKPTTASKATATPAALQRATYIRLGDKNTLKQQLALCKKAGMSIAKSDFVVKVTDPTKQSANVMHAIQVRWGLWSFRYYTDYFPEPELPAERTPTTFAQTMRQTPTQITRS